MGNPAILEVTNVPCLITAGNLFSSKIAPIIHKQ